MDTPESLVEAVRKAWQSLDPGGRVTVRVRPVGLLDVTVVSRRFSGLSSEERERLYWSAVRDLPRDAHVRMTYALLLDPDEAAAYDPRAAADEDASPPPTE